MSKKTTILLIIILALAIVFGVFRIFKGVPLFGPIQPAALKEPKKIGIIWQRQNLETSEGIKAAIKKAGYTNITYEEMRVDATPAIVEESREATKELIKREVDVIFANMEHFALGARQATQELQNDTPIIFFARFNDPVEFGLIESYKSSGNNLTGVSINLVEIVQKHLEFLRAINPSIKKVGVFGNGFIVPPIADSFLAELRTQAKRLGFEAVEYTTNVSPPEAEAAWRRIAAGIKPGDIDAVYHLAGHFFESQEVAETEELAVRLRIPHVVPTEDLPTGGHFGYAGDRFASARQAVDIMGKIFGGAKPSEIPIEFEKKNILVLYVKRAANAGIVFPESMLSIADKKIEE